MRKKFKRPHYPERDRAVFAVLRAIRGMSAPDLARKTFLSATTVYNLRRAQNGTRFPRHLTLVALAEAAGFTYELVPKSDKETVSDKRVIPSERRPRLN